MPEAAPKRFAYTGALTPEANSEFNLSGQPEARFSALVGGSSFTSQIDRIRLTVLAERSEFRIQGAEAGVSFTISRALENRSLDPLGGLDQLAADLFTRPEFPDGDLPGESTPPASIQVAGPGGSFVGQVETVSLVPVPAALPLLLSAVAGLGLARRITR